MLDQFQVRYPTGSLISELLTIYQGKFVVRVSAQVEGVLRATGMSASESLELAEDQARSRALMAMGIEAGRVEGALSSRELFLAGETGNREQGTGKAKQEEQKRVTDTDDLPEESPSTLFSWYQEPETSADFGEPGVSADDSRPLMSFENVTPLVPRAYSPPSAEAMEVREPVDLSNAIARTTVELKRLRWNNQQGREYLKQTYNKRSRQELTDEEMMEFLHYLESQPSPH